MPEEIVNLGLDLDERGGRRAVRVKVSDLHGYTRDGVPTLSVLCDDPRAFEREVERLKTELEEVARAGHAALTGEDSPAHVARESAPAADEGKSQLDAGLCVADAMTRDVQTVSRNDRISVADELMKAGRFRHVVVLEDDGRIAGVVSQRDIVFGAVAWTLGQGRAAHDKALEAYPVKEVMATDVATVDPDAPLREAAALMTERKLGCLPVVEGEALVGILTEGDFLYLLSG